MDQRTRKQVLPIVLAALLTLLGQAAPFPPASAQTIPPTLSAPQLGGFIDIRVDSINQNMGAMAYNSKHQEFLVVWDEPGTSGHREIYGQRVGVDGSPHGVALRLVFDSHYDCLSPAISYSSQQDKYLLVYRIGPSSDIDIRSVLISWDGSTLNYVPIDTDSQRNTWRPDVTYNSQNDEFLVVYENMKPDPGGSEILAQRRKAVDGSQVGTTTTIAGVPGQRRQFPRVAYNNKTHNEYMFAYTYAADTLPATPTKGQFIRYKADLSVALTNETYLTTDDAYDVALSFGSDEYLLVWSGNNVSGGPLTKILGRRVFGNGTLGPLINLADHSPDGCRYPSVVYDSIYSFLITWDYINVSRGNVTDIKGRILPARQDTPSGDEFAVSYIYYLGGGTILLPDGNQTISKAACTALGACLVAYQDSGPNVFVNPDADYEIRGRLVTPVSTSPGGFTKIGPSNGLKGQPTDLLLFWGPSSLVGSYEYCLDTIGNNLCNSGNWIATGTENFVNLSGLSGGTTYYWQVRARNGAGSTEADSGTWWNFSTFQFLTPEGFAKTGPSNGVKEQPANPRLAWGKSSPADSYEYCLDTTGNRICDSGNWKSTGATTSADLSGLVEGTDYYWQVRARNTAGTIEADGGTWWKFSTQKSGSTLYLPLVLNRYSSGSGSSSMTLINQAVAAGILDAETALIYKVYAVFGDNRLPVQYLGASLPDSPVMFEVRRRWTTLSSQTQAILQPFLLPPTEAGSYEQQGLSMTSDGGPLKAPTQWGVIDAARGVRIYYHPRFPEDKAKAKELASEIDITIYPELMAVMENRKWLGFGGDDRLKVYLVSKLSPDGLTVPYSGSNPTAAYILLRRNLALTNISGYDLMSVLAHEMMHAVQYSFDSKKDEETYLWLDEATATWFMGHVYSAASGDYHPRAQDFLNSPSLSLDDGTNERYYGAYLLPFFLTRQHQSTQFVSTVYKNTELFDSLTAVDLAIPGGFEAVWPEFVLHNWNRRPWNDYYLSEGLPYGADYLESTVPLGAFPFAIELKHLTAQYYRMIFDDENVRSVLFYNGLNGKLVEGEAPGQGPNNRKYYHQALTPEETKGIGVQALIKVAGKDWRWEDWSHENVQGFCRDAKAERLEELVLIFSNSEFDPNSPNYVLKPRGLNPTILTSDIGCWQWKGTTTRTMKHDGYDPHPQGPFISHEVYSWNTTVTFERVADLMFEDPVYSVKEGTLVWSHLEEYSTPSIVIGSTTVPLLPTDGTLQTFNSHTGGSRFRGVYGTGQCTTVLLLTCLVGPCFYLSDYNCDWFHTNDATNPPPKITSGTLAEGTYEHTPGYSIVNTWHLEAQREP